MKNMNKPLPDGGVAFANIRDRAKKEERGGGKRRVLKIKLGHCNWKTK